MTRSARAALLGLVSLLGCRATTARPSFVPFPEAETAQFGFGIVDRTVTVGQVTDTLLAYLQRDSIPFRTVRRFDGFLESAWLDAATLKPTTRRPVGDKVVRVRAFIDPGRPGFAHVEVETVYVPFPDPSLSPREQEAPVTSVHPVTRRVAAVLEQLKKKYGAPEDSMPGKKKGPGAAGDTTGAKSKAPADTGKAAPKAPTDTTKAAAKVPADSTKAKPKAPTDTTKAAPKPKAAADTTRRP